MTDEKKDLDFENSAKNKLISGDLGEALDKHSISKDGSPVDILLRVLERDKEESVKENPQPSVFHKNEKAFSVWMEEFEGFIKEAFMAFAESHQDFILKLVSSDGEEIYSIPMAYGNNNTNEFLSQSLGHTLPLLLDFSFRQSMLQRFEKETDENGIPIIKKLSEEDEHIFNFIKSFFESNSPESKFTQKFLKEKDTLYWNWIEQVLNR